MTTLAHLAPILAAAENTDKSGGVSVLIIGLTILLMLFWYFATEKLKRKRNIGTLIVALVSISCVLSIIPWSKKNNETGENEANLTAFVTGKKTFNEASNLNGGIDIVGGTSVLMEVQQNQDPDTGKLIPLAPEAMRSAQDKLLERIDTYGGLNAVINIVGENRIEVQIPRIDPARAKDIIKRLSTAAKLTIHAVHPIFNTNNNLGAQDLAKAVYEKKKVVPTYRAYAEYQKDKEGNYIKTFEKDKDGNDIKDSEKLVPVRYYLVKRRAAIKGSEIERAQASVQNPGQTDVTLSKLGGEQMTALTKPMKRGDLMVSVLDGKVISAAGLNADYLGRNFMITGQENKAESDRLAESLNNPLENDIKVIHQQNVSATLGEATVKQGINAGIAGLGLTLIFVLLYYRYAGIIALAGLFINILILFGAMAAFGAAFTLPGIAGIILTIGVAVDANVLIYERMREELAKGKSVKAAIEAAYEKAFAAIFDANITTLITAIILFWQAAGSVRGFAVTLTIGIMGTLLAALLCTRVFFWWSSDTGILKNIKFMNLVPKRAIDFLSKRKICFILSGALIIVGLASIGMKGKENLGVDFTGGQVLRYAIPVDMDLDQQQVNDAIDHLKLNKAHLSQIEDPSTLGDSKEGRFVKIVCGEDENDVKLIKEAVATNLKITTEPSTDKVSSSLGTEFMKKAIIALLLGMFCVLVYITIRFEFSFAVGAFFALMHDVLLVLGLLFILGQELSLIHISAFLTIIGYSINDTIVVFDRIRESLKSQRGEVKDIMNTAISATLSRTVLTSVTTFVAVLVLYIYGGSALKDFSFTIMIGVIVGTYSSIFIASPIVYIFSKMRGTNLRRELLDANINAEINPAGS